MSKEVKQFTTAKMSPQEIFGNACLKARYAVDEFTAKHGEPMYCGFANISIHPARGPFVTWCKKNHTQSLDIKEEAMNAVSSYFKSLGMTAYAESRAD